MSPLSAVSSVLRERHDQAFEADTDINIWVFNVVKTIQ